MSKVTTTTTQVGEFLSKKIQLGYVKFNSDLMYIPNLSKNISDKLKDMIESHPSLIVTDWDSKLYTVRVFTKQIKNEWYHLGHPDHMKFISEFISNENILKYKTSQYLVIGPVYTVKRDLISVLDKGHEQFFIDFFETNRNKILEVANSNPADSIRLFEFLEKMN